MRTLLVLIIVLIALAAFIGYLVSSAAAPQTDEDKYLSSVDIELDKKGE